MLNPLRKLILAASLGAGIASFAKRCVGFARTRRAGDQKRGAADRRGGSMARWLGLGLGRSGCSRCGCCALVGTALVGPYYGYGPYYPGPYYPGPPPAYYGNPPPAPGYPPPAPGYAVPPGATAGDQVAYCTQRYRSYNPQTGTYFGTDGQRHHCP